MNIDLNECYGRIRECLGEQTTSLQGPCCYKSSAKIYLMFSYPHLLVFSFVCPAAVIIVRQINFNVPARQEIWLLLAG